jgi:hypothetical protein
MKGTLARPLQYLETIYSKPYQFLEKIPERRFEAVFLLSLLSYSLVMVFELERYSSDARLFPLLVGIPLVLMLIVQILLLVLPDKFTPSSGGVFSDMTSSFNEDTDGQASITRGVKIQRETTMVFWIISAILMIWLFGMVVSIPIFVFAFKFVYSKNLLSSTIVAGVVYALIDIIFIRLLNFIFWEGLVFRGGGVL